MMYGTECAKEISLPIIQLKEEEPEREDMALYEREEKEGTKVRFSGTGYNLNGRFYRHGKGRIYDVDGGLEYEGDFFHDSISGHGICYWKNGRILYDGEWKNGLWFGRGRNYWENGKLRIEGTFAEGILHGRGRFYKESGKLYAEANFTHAKVNGEARQYDEESGQLYFEGNYQDNCPHGYGRLYRANGTLEYEGEVKHSELTGYGRRYSENGQLLYEGFFSKGNPVETPVEEDDEKPIGLGRFLLPNGADVESPYSWLRENSEDKRGGRISTLSDLLARSREEKVSGDAVKDRTETRHF